MLDKHYDPAAVERRIYEAWEQGGAFKAGAGAKPGAETFCIVIPPPNVTGNLHMGHALNNTLQDILIRFKRMQGLDVLWQPGTDHAGIATQMVVERQLAERGEPTRWDMGRDAFVERIWQWKAQSGGAIINQLKRLGASCDWSRERFTMDEGLSAAVLKVFVQLYKEGLIYKDKRLVNWDPKLLTAISDLEVQQVETKGHLWHFRYPVEGQEGRYLTVATTRPETMLGDTAVAVHPEDERYKDLIGKHLLLPIVNRRIPVVADEHADPETGSGAVKITPAHDFNDFEVGKRHDLPQINVFDQYAKIIAGRDAQLAGIPSELQGLDRFEARKKIVAWFEEAGLLEKVDDHTLMLPYGDRSNVVIEPWLTDQWYVDAATLAKPAIAAVETGETAFVPKTWEKTYFEWMRNIQPWCISRQLWWGHQIPAWYASDGHIFVEETEAEARAAAEVHFGKPVELKRDPDVLDTWFSSALWPFSTLGWPEETPELARYYKTDVLITGFDIIFFWVARMMMFGMHFMKDDKNVPEVPFHTVYIHALVRDEKGQKMSKSKGNVIDPLTLIDQYGADALRFTLTAMAAQGRDIKLSTGRVEGYRNFTTKLWNAVRFAEMNGCARDPGFDPAKVEGTLNRWIVGETARTADAVTQALDAYRFNEAAGAIYRFVWNVFCDWFLEFAKPVFSGADEAAQAETRATAAWVIDRICRMAHPIMPFVTEEIWGLTGGTQAEGWLVHAAWPEDKGLGDKDADAEIGWVIRLIEGVRSVRAEMNVPAGAKIPLTLKGAGAEAAARLDRHRDLILRLARLESAEVSEEDTPGAVRFVHDEATVLLPIGDVVDLKAERARLEKDLKKLDGEIRGLDAKLSNEKFLANAPEEVVEENRERKAEAEARKAKLADAIAQLAAAG
ncbi:valine--tRNA ligase [Futiania mangrovi]|uniref:Valine--tRNA ligase n=1 Tax=Futiania mangrovi TaxID=2959716 RepID=A0A9J6PE29_9PROT|nr:valine--tRNA ligase [Futiania mangrovii]MCP1335995.1 valine--tRNA ligase [Futiania mangrovii]